MHDYTVAFRAGTLTVSLAAFDTATIDAALLRHAQRIDPGRMARFQRAIEAAPGDLDERVRHHLGMLVEIIYRVVAPSRLKALSAIYDLALAGTSDGEIRARIVTYLGEGPLASALPRLIGAAQRISVADVKRELALVLPSSPYEWAGAADRQLEQTPNHPVALTVAALAQAWLPAGNAGRFTGLLGDALRALPEYDVTPPDAATMFEWVLEQLGGHFRGRRAEWRALAWMSWPDEALDPAAVSALEREVLMKSDATPAERSVVLRRRLSRLSATAREFATEQLGEDA